jgi:hypothetical protein
LNPSGFRWPEGQLQPPPLPACFAREGEDGLGALQDALAVAACYKLARINSAIDIVKLIEEWETAEKCWLS